MNLMTYEEFQQTIITSLKCRFDEMSIGSVVVCKYSTVKPNIPKCNGIQIKFPDNPICPVIYTDKLYLDYCNDTSIEDLTYRILASCINHPAPDYDETMSELMWKNARCNITYRLFNYERNIGYLKDKPFIPFLDLAISFHIAKICPNGEVLSTPVTYSILDEWGIDIQTLLDEAAENTPRLFEARKLGLLEMIADLRGLSIHDFTDSSIDIIPDIAPDMYPEIRVLTNSLGSDGAIAMLYPNVLSEISEEKQSDLYVIPSSIHEVLIIAKNETDLTPDEIEAHINEINSTEVAPEDFLSNHLFIFSRSLKQLMHYKHSL